MRPYHAAVVLFLLLSIFLTNVLSTAATPSTTYAAKVSRTLWVTPYYTQVKDTILVNNTSGGIISYIDFKISAHEYADLFSMSAVDGGGHALGVTLQGAPFETFTFYRVALTNPISAGQTGSITINRYLLFFETSFSQVSANVTQTISISPTILLLNPILKANFTAFVPIYSTSFDFSPTSYSLRNVTFTFTKNTSAHSIIGNLTKIPQPDSIQPIMITFSGDPGAAKATNDVYVTSAQTTISLGDTITASTTFTVYNARGGSDVGKTTTLFFMMPAAVQKDTVTASDFTGDLSFGATPPVQANSNAPVNVTVPARYNINTTQTYQFTLKYQLNPTNVLTKSGDKYTVNLTNISPYIPFVINLQVRLVTPYGASSLKSQQTPSAQGNIGGANFVEFDTVNSSAFSTQNIALSFNYAWYWAFILPWAYTGFIYLLGLVFVAAYLREKPVKAPTAPGVIEDLEKFCDLYDDKTALGLEAQGLEESLRRGKIPKPLYDKRIQEIEARRTNLDRQLGDLSRSIRTSASRYSKSLDQVELLEAELRTVNATTKDLQRQYAARKVSRRVYDDLMYTYEGRLRKIQSRIDSLIINLREGRL